MRRWSVFALLATCLAAQTSLDRYPVVKDGKLGFIDAQGNEVIAPRFSPAGDMAHFQDGLAPVNGAEGSGYIDASGTFVIGPTHEWGQPRPFHDGIACVLMWREGRPGFIDRQGNRPGFIDHQGNLLFSRQWPENSFSEGLMALPEGGTW